jgi:hypothetical protein
MTETREIGRDAYREIANTASGLIARLSDLMRQVRPEDITQLPTEWHELHDLMSLAGVIAAQAGRYSTEAPDLDAPVPYLPADGMRDLDAAVKAANPAHAIYARPPASCGHPMNDDGECDCAWWPERAPITATAPDDEVIW